MDLTHFTQEDASGASSASPVSGEDPSAALAKSSSYPSPAASMASDLTPLSGVIVSSPSSSSVAVSRDNSIRSTIPGSTPAAAPRIRKGLLSRAGSEAEDRSARTVSSSSRLPPTTDDDDEEDETIISDSGPMPRRFASQKRGVSSVHNARQTSNSSLSPTHWPHNSHPDQASRSPSASGYASGSRSGSGEASEAHSSTGAVSLERAMSISSVSSVNSTSSLEATPFREAPRGNVRLGFARGTYQATPIRSNLADTQDGDAQSQQLPSGSDQMSNSPEGASQTTETSLFGASAPSERKKRIPKAASDTWMYRVGPGMRTTKGRGFAPTNASALQDPPVEAQDETMGSTPSKRSRDALRQKFVKGTGRMGVQSSISTQAPPMSSEYVDAFNHQVSSDDDAKLMAPARTPLPRSSSYFSNMLHSATSVTDTYLQPSLTPVPADFPTSSITNAPLVVPKYPDTSPLLARTTDKSATLSSALSILPLMSLDDSLDVSHPRSASTFITSRRRSSATQRPVPVRAESSDDAFDRVASPGLNVDDPSAVGASPAEPALYTLSPSASSSHSFSTGRFVRPPSITSAASLRPTPAEIVRLEAQAGIASLPDSPSEPSPVPSGYDSGVSEMGSGAGPTPLRGGQDRRGSLSASDTSFSVDPSSGQIHHSESLLSPGVWPTPRRPNTLRARGSGSSIARDSHQLTHSKAHSTKDAGPKSMADPSHCEVRTKLASAGLSNDLSTRPTSRATVIDESESLLSVEKADTRSPESTTFPSGDIGPASTSNAYGRPATASASNFALPRSVSPASQLARSPETIRAGSITRFADSVYGMSPVSVSSLRSPKLASAGVAATVERSRSPATARSPVDFHYGETLGEGSYSTVLEAWDLLSGPSPKQPGVVDPDAISASAAMVGADSSRRRRRQIDLTGRKSYAIKVLDKVHILKQGKQKYVTVEREALSRMIRHSGVVTLFWTFQDRESLYFVLELASNGELLESIRQHGSFDKPCARFYAAQLAETIDAMHKAGVVHRDLKPENILLDSHYRIKVTDFGSAKIVHAPNADPDATGQAQQQTLPSEAKENGVRAHRAASFVGTAEYVSPELLVEKGEPAGKPADWWAFGCVVFQMLAGRPPFKGVNEYQTLQKVKHRDFTFPDGFPDDARDLVNLLLALKPAERLTASEVKAHTFFDGICFDKLWDIEAVPMKTGLTKPAPKVAHPRLDVAETSDFSFDEDFISSEDSQAYAVDSRSVDDTDDRSGPDESRSRPTSQHDLENATGPANNPDISNEASRKAPFIDGPIIDQASKEHVGSGVKSERGTTQRSARVPAPSSMTQKQDVAAMNSNMAGVQSWAALLLPQEIMLYSVPVQQKKTGAGKMFTKRRQLIITDFPRLLCVKETASTLKVKSEVILAIPASSNRANQGEIGFEKVSSGRYGESEVADERHLATSILRVPDTISTSSPNLLMGVEFRSGKSFVLRTSAQSYIYEVLSGDAAALVKQIRDAKTKTR